MWERAIVAVCLCGPVAAEKKPVTVEAVSAAPRLRGSPVWAPDGKRFVYIENRKLWLYDIPAKTARALAALAPMEEAAVKAPPEARFAFQNRSVTEQVLQWFPSGRELLVSAGGDLFVFRIDAGGWVQLTATAEKEADPKLSPDGKKVSFRRGHDLYALEITSRKVTRLTEDGSPTLLNAEVDWVYPEELFLGTAHWWSPDSTSIAYLQFDVSREQVYPQVDLLGLKAVYEPERYPQAGDANADVRLGIVAAGGGRTLWTDLGQTRDSLRARFYWLPDSSGVAVERLNRVQNRMDLLIAGAKDGGSRTVLTETDPAWINVRDDFRFLRGGKEILWGSERDGFNHLYRYSIGGKALGRLTRGDWEVSSVACVDEAAGQVYYTSTEAGPLERQLYRVGLEGGSPVRITKAAGTHEISMGPTCEYYLDTFSSLTAPTQRTVYKRDGSEWAVYRPADKRDLEEFQMMSPEIVPVKASDGTVLYGRLVKPAGFQSGRKYPVVVQVYGGPHVQSVRNAWPGVRTMDQALAQRGYVVWALDNRGTSGRGHAFEAAVNRNLGEKEVADQVEGVRQLVAMGIADPARVGITGWSYGGYMTIHSLLEAPETFACGVAGAPVTDWRNYDTIYTERYMGLPSENAAGYDRSSNVKNAAKLKGKLLIAHNLEDDNVLVQNTAQMVNALEDAKRQFGLMVYPNKSHGLVRGRGHFNEMTVEFFEGCLK